MKVVTLQISNVLSFCFNEDIATADKISFDDGLNLIIGENGSGKSTALEVLNFIFRRVLFRQYNLNQDLYAQRSAIAFDQRKQTLQPTNNNSFGGFRLDPNWNTESKPQTIRTTVRLDEIDIRNIQLLLKRREMLAGWVERYSMKGVGQFPAGTIAKVRRELPARCRIYTP